MLIEKIPVAFLLMMPAKPKLLFIKTLHELQKTV